ncbi:hypothetical protein MKX66_29600 [Bacillus sp. FSL R9-9530]
MLEYNVKEIQETLSRYNGTGDEAYEYGLRNSEIYKGFEKYNVLSRLGR